MFDIKKNEKQFLIAMAGASAVVVLVYIVFILWPQLVSLVTTAQKAGKVGIELKVAEEDIARMDILRKAIDVYREKIDLYEKRLPVEQEIPSLLESLSDMAKSCNVKIISIIPAVVFPKEGKAAKGQIYQEIPILITAKSGYHELGYFLSRLENNDRFMKVTDINIKANRATPRSHDVELMVSTYISLREQ